MGYFDEYNKGFREAGTIWQNPLPTFAEKQGQDAARAGGGGAGAGIAGLVLLVYALLVLAGAFCIAVVALFGTPFVLLGVKFSRPKDVSDPRHGFVRAYGTMFFVLLANAGILAVWFTAISAIPEVNALLAAAHAQPEASGRLIGAAVMHPLALMVGVFAEFLAILAGAAIIRGRHSFAYAGALSFLKAWLTSLASLTASLGAAAFFVATRTHSDDLQDFGIKLLAAGLVAGGFALLGAPLGAIVTVLVERSANRNARNSFWRAFAAAFLGLAAYAAVVLVYEAWTPALRPVVDSLIEAYKASHGVPPPLTPPPYAVSIPSFLLEQALSFTAFVAVVAATLNSPTQGFGGWARAAVAAGGTWSAVAAILVGIWLAGPNSHSRSLYPSPASLRPIQIAPTPRATVAAKRLGPDRVITPPKARPLH